MKPVPVPGAKYKGILEYRAGGEPRWMVRLKVKDETRWRAITKRGFLTLQDAQIYRSKFRKLRYHNRFTPERLSSAIFKEAANRRLPRNSKVIPLAWDNKDLPRTGVYFIQPSAGGLIKIGYTDDIHKRFRQIQYQCPVPLKVLGVIPGDTLLEISFHMDFIQERHHGEWFLPQGRVKEFLLELGLPFIDPVFTYTKDWEPKALERLKEHFGNEEKKAVNSTADCSVLGRGHYSEEKLQHVDNKQELHTERCESGRFGRSRKPAPEEKP